MQIPGPSVTDQTTRRKLDYIDALRGIAILGVVCVHTAGYSNQTGLRFQLGFVGQRGVQLFYLLSAFTLCLSLDTKKSAEEPILNYFVRRFFRIAPLYYAAILANSLLLLVNPIYSAQRGLHGYEVGLGVLFLNGLSPGAINHVVDGGWSIAVESTFYLFLPYLFAYFNDIRRCLLLLLGSACLLGPVSTYLAHRFPDEAQYFSFLWFPVEFPIFVMGMLCYCAWKEHIEGKTIAPASRKTASSLLLLFSASLLWSCFPLTDSKLYVSSFAFFPFILGLSLYQWPVFVNRGTRFLGKISYSLYLTHFFVLVAMLHADKHIGHPLARWANDGLSGFVGTYLATLCFAIPLSILSWRYIEQPGINLGRFIIARRAESRSSLCTTVAQASKC